MNSTSRFKTCDSDICYRELGIGIVPYSPLGRRFFGGRAVLESVPASSVLVWNFHLVK